MAQNQVSEVINTVDLSSTFSCDICHEESESRNIVIKHIEENHLKLVRCQQCKTEFGLDTLHQELEMKEHVELNHKRDRQVSKNDTQNKVNVNTKPQSSNIKTMGNESGVKSDLESEKKSYTLNDIDALIKLRNILIERRVEFPSVRANSRRVYQLI